MCFYFFLVKTFYKTQERNNFAVFSNLITLYKYAYKSISLLCKFTELKLIII